MSTLYRKYRPAGFFDISGQNHVKVTLEHAVKTGKLAHAFLFCGPRGIGKTTMARVLAKVVNCENRKDNESEPCGKCPSCEGITEGKMLDVIEIDAASHTGVDNVRENIIAVSRLAPSKNKKKVFIIDEVHMLSVSAFNALLKVLEEPPQNVIFILCTTEVHKIPTTIISRCERYDFKKISISDVVARLEEIAKQEKVTIDSQSLKEIARFSEGYMRDALSLLGQVFSIGGSEISKEDVDLVIPRTEIKEVFSLLNFLQSKNAAQAIELVNSLQDDGVDLKKFVSDTVDVMRLVLLKKINPAMTSVVGQELSEENEAKLVGLSQNFELDKIIKMIEKMIEARKNIDTNFITQLPIEIAIVEICNNPGKLDVKIPKEEIVVKKEASTFSPPPSSNASPEIKKKEISAKWHEVLAKIKKHNHSLSFILRVCEPRSISGNQVCLAFKYKFHKERIDEHNIKQIIEKVLQEVYGKNLIVEAILDENLQVATEELVSDPPEENKENNPQKIANSNPETKNTGKAVDQLLKTFGGKVVEN